jgi:hypothetical protein
MQHIFPTSITAKPAVARKVSCANSLGQAVPADTEDLITIISQAKSDANPQRTEAQKVNKSINLFSLNWEGSA